MKTTIIAWALWSLLTLSALAAESGQPGIPVPVHTASDPLTALSAGMLRLREALIVQRLAVQERAKTESPIRKLIFEEQGEQCQAAANNLAAQVATLSDLRANLSQVRALGLHAAVR